jgi:hypothetical protein
VPDKPHGPRSLVGAAGRTAVALLRSSRRRAKLGSLHLPLSLNPLRQSAIAPAPAPRQLRREAEPAVVDVPRPALNPEVRALMSRLAMAERRNARLRQALRRERIAAARAGATLERPGPLIDQLAAELGAAGMDQRQARELVSSVLGAYGFQVISEGMTTAETELDRGPAGIPGMDRGRLEALTHKLLHEQPEISSPRYINAVMETLAAEGPVTLARLASTAKLTSPVARRRLRLALEGLVNAGVVQCAGDRYMLAKTFQ